MSASENEVAFCENEHCSVITFRIAEQPESQNCPVCGRFGRFKNKSGPEVGDTGTPADNDPDRP